MAGLGGGSDTRVVISLSPDIGGSNPTIDADFEAKDIYANNQFLVTDEAVGFVCDGSPGGGPVGNRLSCSTEYDGGNSVAYWMFSEGRFLASDTPDDSASTPTANIGINVGSSIFNQGNFTINSDNNITMTSPDGSKFNCGVSNAGAFSCS